MSSNITTCHNCPERTRPCNGPCPCKADAAGRDILAIAKAGDCPLGLFGNAVSLAKAGEGQRVMLTIARGAAGLAKAALGIDRADQETIDRRRGICGECPHNVGRLLQRCEACGCGLAAKTALKGESCPIGKWPAVTD